MHEPVALAADHEPNAHGRHVDCAAEPSVSWPGGHGSQTTLPLDAAIVPGWQATHDT